MALGLRVIRSPGWSRGDVDGGLGHVGTIVSAGADGKIEVAWDGGRVITLPAVSKDLRVLDNAPVGVRHAQVSCDGCNEVGIVGMRWKCAACGDFDLCSLCYFSDYHDRNHQFLRYETPTLTPTKMERRSKSMKIGVVGLFPDATVVRGRDWEWKDQDGGRGKEGIVLSVMTPGESSARSTVKVEWKNGLTNVYRVGFKGKVDLQYTEEAPGGECYPEHLPVFDARNYKSSVGGDMQLVPVQDSIREGDKVLIHFPQDKIQQLRSSKSEISEILNKVGEVKAMTFSGEALVSFGPDRYKIGLGALRKVPVVSVGDHVRVLEDEERVASLQDGHKGYNKDMRRALGKVGEVIDIDEDGDVVVQFGARHWVYNPACLIPVPGQSLDNAIYGDEDDDDHDEDDDDFTLGDSGLNMLGQLMGAMALAAASQAQKQMDGLAFVQALVDNDMTAVRQMLQRDPNLVTVTVKGIGVLHIAANKGLLQMVEILLQKGAKLDQRDSSGNTALLLSVKQEAVADFLMRKGSDIALANNDGQTVCHLAALHGSTQVLRQLMARGADFNVTDKDGDTPIHDAISQGRTAAAQVLLSWPKLDLRRRNKKDLPPLHFAAFKGEAAIAELIVMKDKTLVNDQNDEGYAPLHVAAINNYTDVMRVLIEKGGASLDVKSRKKHTPLHLAAEEAYMDAVQMLLKHGADVSAKDDVGNRPLHILLASNTQPVPADALFLLLLLGQAPKAKAEERVRIACYLIQAGADPEARNNNGKTAMDICGNQTIVDNIKRFMQENKAELARQRPRTPLEARTRCTTASDLCRRCSRRRADILLIPCAHKALCRTCSVGSGKIRVCPQCQGFISTMFDEDGKELKTCIVM